MQVKEHRPSRLRGRSGNRATVVVDPEKRHWTRLLNIRWKALAKGDLRKTGFRMPEVSKLAPDCHPRLGTLFPPLQSNEGRCGHAFVESLKLQRIAKLLVVAGQRKRSASSASSAASADASTTTATRPAASATTAARPTASAAAPGA